MGNVKLTEAEIRALEKRMEELAAAGVKTATEAAGELNMSGCASGYCQAWA